MATTPVMNVSYYPADASTEPPEVYIDGDIDTDADSGEEMIDVGLEENVSSGSASALPVAPKESNENLGDETKRSAVGVVERRDSDSMLGESLGKGSVGSNVTASADATDSDLWASGRFGSASSYGVEDGGQGEAEREAEEVQALVAEALALVKEANEDS